MTRFCLITSVGSNFEKIGRVLFHKINLMKKSQSKLKFSCVKKKLRKLQMNEHEISIHVNNSGLQIVQIEFTT